MRRWSRRVLGSVAVAFAALSLSSCEPQAVAIKACTSGGKLAFQIADTKGWFSTTTARPWSITVLQPFAGEVWDTQVPHDQIEDRQHSHQPMRNVLLYGVPRDGWEVRQAPTPLKSGTKYRVEIWSDGGRGLIDFTSGGPLPACDPVKGGA
jgi:hypothetical protein